jgi:hypothetical protein
VLRGNNYFSITADNRPNAPYKLPADDKVPGNWLAKTGNYGHTF